MCIPTDFRLLTFRVADNTNGQQRWENMQHCEEVKEKIKATKAKDKEENNDQDYALHG